MNKLCWCENSNLEEFSPGYWRCSVCSTLISKSLPSVDITAISDEDGDFYGKTYWLDHQVKELGLTSIEERSRSDLLDRCGWWLSQLLQFRLPPARLLEIGCSHGAFLALAKLTGFHVTGVELSPWVVEFARKTFEVDVRIGPIERQAFEAGSFDVICMFDVLEHLQDPLRTLECCAQALTPDGILLIQTPQYPTATDFADLQEGQHPFLRMLLPDEHLFLFSTESVKRLLGRTGLCVQEFLPARFGLYDMMLVATKSQLSRTSPPAIAGALEKDAGARVIQAFLSLFQQNSDLEAGRADLQNRLNRIHQAADERLQVLERASDQLKQQSEQLQQQSEQVQQQQHQLKQQSEELCRTKAEREELRQLLTIRGMIRFLLGRIASGKK
jgi:2-polyprenyl-3-methyl-5-hydroxy-6-metoxy-1,4-benzoquinol methylase